MAIRSVVTRGFGNGTFNGTIPLVVTRGYAISAAASPVGGPYLQLTVVGSSNRLTPAGSLNELTPVGSRNKADV